jgi:hypothetical protein
MKSDLVRAWLRDLLLFGLAAIVMVGGLVVIVLAFQAVTWLVGLVFHLDERAAIEAVAFGILFTAMAGVLLSFLIISSWRFTLRRVMEDDKGEVRLSERNVRSYRRSFRGDAKVNAWLARLEKEGRVDHNSMSVSTHAPVLGGRPVPRKRGNPMNYRNLYEDLKGVRQALNIDSETVPANVPKASFLLGAIMTKALLRAEEQEAAMANAASPAYPTSLPTSPSRP